MRAATQTRAQRRAENALIKKALKVLEDRLEYERVTLSTPDAVRNLLTLRMAELEHETFVALWLNAQNRLIECEELFKGTLTQADQEDIEMGRIPGKSWRWRDGDPVMIRHVYENEKIAIKDLLIVMGHDGTAQLLSADSEAALKLARQRLSSLPGGEVLDLILKINRSGLTPIRP